MEHNCGARIIEWFGFEGVIKTHLVPVTTRETWLLRALSNLPSNVSQDRTEKGVVGIRCSVP